jgi:hypothetical protein
VNQPDKSATPVKFPRRDANGRVANAMEFLASAFVLVALGLIVLVAIDGLFTLIGVGDFGKISGWLAGILMVFLFIDDFRAWRGVTLRVLVAIFGIAVGVVLGSLVNGAVDGLPTAFSGAIAVTVAGLVYAVIWFFGIRWSAARFGDPGAVASRSVRGGK